MGPRYLDLDPTHLPPNTPQLEFTALKERDDISETTAQALEHSDLRFGGSKVAGTVCERVIHLIKPHRRKLMNYQMASHLLTVT